MYEHDATEIAYRNGFEAGKQTAIKEIEANGEWVHLPCKVGDTVYCIDEDKTISKWYVAGFKKYFDIAWVCEIRNNLNKWNYIEKTAMFSNFGESIFTTRKFALEKMKGEKK